MPDLRRRRYRQHKANAKARGIPFFLTFEEWWSLWLASGKWERRGWGKGQYCMARPGDLGAYEIGNVIICLAEENRAERNKNYPVNGENNPAYGKNYFQTMSADQQADWVARISAIGRRPKSAAWRAARSAATTGRRRVVRNGRSTWAYPGDPDFPG